MHTLVCEYCTGYRYKYQLQCYILHRVLINRDDKRLTIVFHLLIAWFLVLAKIYHSLSVPTPNVPTGSIYFAQYLLCDGYIYIITYYMLE